MTEVTMYGTQWFPFCRRAEQLLQRKGVTDLKKSRSTSNLANWKS